MLKLLCIDAPLDKEFLCLALIKLLMDANIHKNRMIHGPKIQVVFELTAAYAPEKDTVNHNDGC